MFVDVSTLKGNSRNTLTDDQVTICYSDIPQVYENIRRVLSIESVDRDKCVALECENSVPTAVLLLFLLDNGYNVFLYPKTRRDVSLRGGEEALPSFCSYMVSTAALGADQNLASDIFFHVTTIQRDSNAKMEAGRIYLRTSGSTGVPKTVAHSHKKLEKNALNCVERLGLREEDRVTIAVPIFHMYGLGAGFQPSVAAGASVDLQNNSNILKFLHREAQFQPSVAFLTPTFCESVNRFRRTNRQYRLTVVAGDRLRREAYWDHEGKSGTLIQLYGSTEMGALAAGSPRDVSEVRSRTVGTPMSGAFIQIRQSGDIPENADNGETGELWCRYKYGFDGYADEYGVLTNEFTAAESQWWNTIDVAQVDSAGNLEILGRADQCVNRDGRLVSFSFVERALEAEGAIDRAVVVSRGDGKRGKELAVFCVGKHDTHLTAEVVKCIAQRVLPKYAVPEIVVVCASLPLLDNGKVDRVALALKDCT